MSIPHHTNNDMKPQDNSLIIPKELQFLIDKNNVFASSFESLSPPYKIEYAEYIEEAKLEEIKRKRLEKIIPMILESKSLHDK